MAAKRVGYVEKDAVASQNPGVLRPFDWSQVTFGDVTGWEPTCGMFQRKAVGTPFGQFDAADDIARVDDIHIGDAIAIMRQSTDGTIGGTMNPRNGR